MSKEIKEELGDDMRTGYDFNEIKGGVRVKYAKCFHAGTNLVLLEPDIARAFDDDATVNDVLRSFVKVAQSQAKIAQ